jgi:hypothetical protein
MESMRTTQGVHVESTGVHQDFIRTLPGVCRDVWGSVTYRNCAHVTGSNYSIGYVQVAQLEQLKGFLWAAHAIRYLK